MYIKLFIFSILLVSFACCEVDEPTMNECPPISDKWTVTASGYPLDYSIFGVFFTDRNTGYTYGQRGYILKSVNGGSSWLVIHDQNSVNNETKLKLTKGYFLNSLFGYIGGERMEIGFGDELLKGALLLKTIDGGASWSKKYFSNIQEFVDFHFFDELNGIAIASYDTNQTLRNKLLLTNNGGNTWTNAPIISDFVPSDNFEIIDSTIVLVGHGLNNKSEIMISHDKGFNWNSKSLPEDLCSRVFLVNKQFLFVTCGLLFLKERVYESSGNFDSWQANINAPLSSFSFAHFDSDQYGIIINKVFSPFTSGGETVLTLDSFDIHESFGSLNNWTRNSIDSPCYEMDGPGFNLDENSFYIMGDKFNSFTMK